MKQIQKHKDARTSPRRTGLSGVVYLIIIVGITIGVTFTVVGDITDSFDTMTSSNRLAIEGVNAYTDGDRLVISGNIKNLGSQPLSSITLDEITVGDLVLTQVIDIADGQIVDGGDHAKMSLSGLPNTGTTRVSDNGVAHTPNPRLTDSGLTWTSTSGPGFYFYTAGNSTDDGIAKVELTGFSVSGATLSTISAGSSQAFRIVITGDSTSSDPDMLDILRTVPASAELFITVTGTDGDITTISEPRTTRVTQR